MRRLLRVFCWFVGHDVDTIEVGVMHGIGDAEVGIYKDYCRRCDWQEG